MSSYERYKVLRLPISKIGENVENFEDLSYFKDIKAKYGIDFAWTYTCSESCIDLLLDEDTECYDEFGSVRYLTSEEKENAIKIFNLLNISYDVDAIHYVDYCYYNCSEPPFYYEVANNSFVISKLEELSSKITNMS